jgi:hypothetical protein
MPTIEVLERAAGSLGFATSRSGPALKVTVYRGLVLQFAEVDGQPVTTVQYGWAPDWFFRLCTAVAAGAASVSILTAPLGRSTVLLMLMVLGSIWAYGAMERKSERAQERLLDRAYDMGKAA